MSGSKPIYKTTYVNTEEILIQIFQGVQTCQLSVSITLQTTCNTHLLHTHYHIGILRVKTTQSRVEQSNVMSLI